MDPWSMREARRAAGLTAKQVARATGTSETNIAAYERGDKTPNGATLARIVSAIDAGSTSPVFAYNLLTVPSAAAAIRKGLRESWKVSDLLRIVRESRNNTKWLVNDNDRQLFFAQPSTTGDRRWDALLAGSTEQMMDRHGRPPPRWTAGHGLRTFWFVGTNPAFDAYTLAHSPAALKVRGVMIDPSSLESV